MRVYLQKDILQDVLCALVIWNTLEDKLFQPNAEFFPYFLSCHDHEIRSSLPLVRPIAPIIVHYSRRKFTQKDARLLSLRKNYVIVLSNKIDAILIGLERFYGYYPFVCPIT